jgi:hypothetical protein
MARPASDAGPIGHRDAPFSIAATAILSDPDSKPATRSFVDAFARRLRPYATGGSFLNFLTDPGRTVSAFTVADHARLVDVKRSWDPGNHFRLNHNLPVTP